MDVERIHAGFSLFVLDGSFLILARMAKKIFSKTGRFRFALPAAVTSTFPCGPGDRRTQRRRGETKKEIITPAVSNRHPSHTTFTPGSLATWRPVYIFAVNPPNENTSESLRRWSRSDRPWRIQRLEAGRPGFSMTNCRAGPFPWKSCS